MVPTFLYRIYHRHWSAPHEWFFHDRGLLLPWMFQAYDDKPNFSRSTNKDGEVWCVKSWGKIGYLHPLSAQRQVLSNNVRTLVLAVHNPLVLPSNGCPQTPEGYECKHPVSLWEPHHSYWVNDNSRTSYVTGLGAGRAGLFLLSLGVAVEGLFFSAVKVSGGLNEERRTPSHPDKAIMWKNVLLSKVATTLVLLRGVLENLVTIFNKTSWLGNIKMQPKYNNWSHKTNDQGRYGIWKTD